MFIKSVSSGGGYRGDVNSAFRQGRQDAFRDYVSNFNFATAADAANNAENQRNVQRLADNYQRELAMGQMARTDAINFANDSARASDARTNADITFAKNNALSPQAGALGASQARATVANTANEENTAVYNAQNSADKLANAPVEFAARTTGNEAQVAKNNTAITQADLVSKAQATNQDIATHFSDRGIADFNKAYLDDRVSKYLAQNPGADRTAVTQQFLKDPSFLQQRQAEYGRVGTVMRNQSQAYQNQLNGISQTEVQQQRRANTKAVENNTYSTKGSKVFIEPNEKVDGSDPMRAAVIQNMLGKNAYVDPRSGTLYVRGSNGEIRSQSFSTGEEAQRAYNQFVSMYGLDYNDPNAIRNSGGE